jgi:hypothetical protein
MKLRITGNSIRLRLGQSEVRRLVREDVVEESITFDSSRGQRLSYVLCTGPNLLVATADYQESRIVIRLRTALAREWASSDQIGIEAIQVSGDGGILRILIEKDLECIDAASDESQADAFAHPQRGVSCLPENQIARSR